MRTVRSSSHPGGWGLHQAPPRTDTPGTRHPREQTPPGCGHPPEQTPPPGADTPGSRHTPAGTRHPPGKKSQTPVKILPYSNFVAAVIKKQSVRSPWGCPVTSTSLSISPTNSNIYFLLLETVIYCGNFKTFWHRPVSWAWRMLNRLFVQHLQFHCPESPDPICVICPISHLRSSESSATRLTDGVRVMSWTSARDPICIICVICYKADR